MRIATAGKSANDDGSEGSREEIATLHAGTRRVGNDKLGLNRPDGKGVQFHIHYHAP